MLIAGMGAEIETKEGTSRSECPISLLEKPRSILVHHLFQPDSLRQIKIFDSFNGFC